MALPRVLLADDHTLVIEALYKLLEPHFNIVGAVADGMSLVQTAEGYKRCSYMPSGVLFNEPWNVSKETRLRRFLYLPPASRSGS